MEKIPESPRSAWDKLIMLFQLFWNLLTAPRKEKFLAEISAKIGDCCIIQADDIGTWKLTPVEVSWPDLNIRFSVALQDPPPTTSILHNAAQRGPLQCGFTFNRGLSTDQNVAFFREFAINGIRSALVGRNDLESFSNSLPPL